MENLYRMCSCSGWCRKGFAPSRCLVLSSDPFVHLVLLLVQSHPHNSKLALCGLSVEWVFFLFFFILACAVKQVFVFSWCAQFIWYRNHTRFLLVQKGSGSQAESNMHVPSRVLSHLRDPLLFVCMWERMRNVCVSTPHLSCPLPNEWMNLPAHYSDTHVFQTRKIQQPDCTLWIGCTQRIPGRFKVIFTNRSRFVCVCLIPRNRFAFHSRLRNATPGGD